MRIVWTCSHHASNIQHLKQLIHRLTVTIIANSRTVQLLVHFIPSWKSNKLSISSLSYLKIMRSVRLFTVILPIVSVKCISSKTYPFRSPYFVEGLTNIFIDFFIRIIFSLSVVQDVRSEKQHAFKRSHLKFFICINK